MPQKKNMPLSERILLIVFLLLVFSSFPLSGEDDRVISGVSFNGQELGGKSKAEVLALLEEEDRILGNQVVYLYFPGEKTRLESSYNQLGIHIDAEKVWQEAFLIGRAGRWWEDIWTRWQVKRHGAQIPLYLFLNVKNVGDQLNKLSQPWYLPPKDARLLIKADDSIEIIPHQLGRCVDITRGLEDLQQLVTASPGNQLHLSLKFMELSPAKLTRTIESYNIKGVVSTFVTRFNSGVINRANNIRLAARALDNYLLAPGAIFSFNDVVGPRTKAKGYDEADIILRNELVPDVGGGVCQVSTTLYNAVLQAELEIVERAPHSMIISYVAPGLDATVVYGYRDLKFRNNTSGHLVIKSRVTHGVLTVKIFGAPQPSRRVVLKSIKEKEIPPKTIYRDDPLVPRGKYVLEREGQKGYIYRVERHIYDDKGTLIDAQFISRDLYPPQERVIKTWAGSPLLSNSHNL